MAQTGAHGGMDIQEHKQMFSGFMSATTWTSIHIVQALALLTLAFAIGAGWWAGVTAFIVIGVAAGLLFKMGGVFWAAQIVQWVLLVIGGLLVPALAGIAG